MTDNKSLNLLVLTLHLLNGIRSVGPPRGLLDSESWLHQLIATSMVSSSVRRRQYSCPPHRVTVRIQEMMHGECLAPQEPHKCELLFSLLLRDSQTETKDLCEHRLPTQALISDIDLSALSLQLSRNFRGQVPRGTTAGQTEPLEFTSKHWAEIVSDPQSPAPCRPVRVNSAVSPAWAPALGKRRGKLSKV